MKQYEVLMAKKLFAGSDIIRGFGYKAGRSQDNYAFFGRRIVLYFTHHTTRQPVIPLFLIL